MSYSVRIIMKRLWVLFVMIIVSGCTPKDGYRTKISKEEYETDYSTVYAEIIEFDGFSNREYQSELNLSIQKEVGEAIKKFDSLAQEGAADMPKGIKSALYLTQNVKRNKIGLISFVEEEYVYLGGAHGLTSWNPKTIDTEAENPHVLELSELFVDEGYINEINRNIDLLIEKEPEKYSELWADPHINGDADFYLTDEDLVIFYPPYELSYYAKGFIEFPIRLSVISGYLKPEYRP